MLARIAELGQKVIDRLTSITSTAGDTLTLTSDGTRVTLTPSLETLYIEKTSSGSGNTADALLSIAAETTGAPSSGVSLTSSINSTNAQLSTSTTDTAEVAEVFMSADNFSGFAAQHSASITATSARVYLTATEVGTQENYLYISTAAGASPLHANERLFFTTGVSPNTIWSLGLNGESYQKRDAHIVSDTYGLMLGAGTGGGSGDARLHYNGTDTVLTNLIGSGALRLGTPFAVGTDGSAQYNVDLHMDTAGKGVQWRPAAASNSPKLIYYGEKNQANHVLLDASIDTTVTSSVLLDGDFAMSGSSVGKSIAIVLDFTVTDTRSLTAAAGSADAIRPIQVTATRNGSFTTDQGFSAGTGFIQLLRSQLTDAGNYTKSNGGVHMKAEFAPCELSSFSPVFSATSGSNSYTLRGHNFTGTIGGNGNAQTSLDFVWTDIAHTYVQLSGFLGFGAGATHYGMRYRPSITAVTGVITEAAVRADRSGIYLASDFTSNTDSSGYLRMGGGGDAEIGYNGTNLIIDPDLVGSGRVLIGVTGDDDMLLNAIEIDGDLNHDGTNVGFYGIAPTTRPAAYTQTYSTATRTHSNLTSATLTDSSGGTADTTVAAISGTGDDGDINNNFADLTAQVNALRVDLTNLKGVVNQVIDDFQLNGLLQ